MRAAIKVLSAVLQVALPSFAPALLLGGWGGLLLSVVGGVAALVRLIASDLARDLR